MDWSSDVCSSDLGRRPGDGRLVPRSATSRPARPTYAPAPTACTDAAYSVQAKTTAPPARPQPVHDPSWAGPATYAPRRLPPQTPTDSSVPSRPCAPKLVSVKARGEPMRTEERRVGEEFGSTVRSRWSAEP